VPTPERLVLPMDGGARAPYAVIIQRLRAEFGGRRKPRGNL